MKLLQSPITSFLFGQNVLLGTLFSNTHSLCSSLNVRDQVSHPYCNQKQALLSDGMAVDLEANAGKTEY
jgi:polysaccharide pyruvyl transferase WcaK-like protein